MIKLFTWLCILCLLGCSPHSKPFSTFLYPEITENNNPRPVFIKELSQNIEIFDHVIFRWNESPTSSEVLKQYLDESKELFAGKTVLDLGTGTGIIGLITLHYGAKKVVATDINVLAAANAIHNAALLGMTNKMDVRLVSKENPGAYSVIREIEKFDFILSDPPHYSKPSGSITSFDPNFNFLRSMIVGLKDHLTQTGKLLLIHRTENIDLITQIATKNNCEVKNLSKKRALPNQQHWVMLEIQLITK